MLYLVQIAAVKCLEASVESFRVEYLITVDQNDPFCSTVNSFNNLLRTIDGLTMSGSLIEYKTLQIQYEVQLGEITTDKHRFFHVKLICNDKEQLELYEGFLRAIRTVLHRASNKPVYVLWDDIGFYFAQLAYPVVYEIENIMRKLITKFMLTTAGIAWTNDSIPQEVAESIRTKASKNSFNYLYETDFIQLSNFLFKEYTSMNTKNFTDRIRSAKALQDLQLEELKLIVPRSNWERYFSKIVNCESDYLRLRWDKLYERRNQVAHNKSINKGEFDEITRLIGEIRPKLQEAISKLDQITVSPEDREAVAENVAENTNALFGEFLYEWKQLSENIFQFALTASHNTDSKQLIERDRYNLTKLIEWMHRGKGLINRDLMVKIRELMRHRNVMVHEPNIQYTSERLIELINMVQECRREVLTLLESEKNKNNENPSNNDTVTENILL